MALYGTQRDISLFRHLNRELMGDIITQQCAFYKFKIEETKVNLYGEATDEKYYMGPVLLNCLIERQNEEHPIDDFGTGFKWDIVFKFLRDDLGLFIVAKLYSKSRTAAPANIRVSQPPSQKVAQTASTIRTKLQHSTNSAMTR